MPLIAISLEDDSVVSRWRQSPAGPKDDVDGDGIVTVTDVMLVTAEWAPCPQSPPFFAGPFLCMLVHRS